MHLIAVTQIRNDTPGRIYYERKIAEGKSKKEAMRALKRRISDALWRQFAGRPRPTLNERAREGKRDDSEASVTGSAP